MALAPAMSDATINVVNGRKLAAAEVGDLAFA